jgi:hypothetical protein
VLNLNLNADAREEAAGFGQQHERQHELQEVRVFSKAEE